MRRALAPEVRFGPRDELVDETDREGAVADLALAGMAAFRAAATFCARIVFGDEAADDDEARAPDDDRDEGAVIGRRDEVPDADALAPPSVLDPKLVILHRKVPGSTEVGTCAMTIAFRSVKDRMVCCFRPK